MKLSSVMGTPSGSMTRANAGNAPNRSSARDSRAPSYVWAMIGCAMFAGELYPPNTWKSEPKLLQGRSTWTDRGASGSWVSSRAVGLRS